MSGVARREAVVLLHSSASSAAQWNDLARCLAPRHDVLALDFHGHGAAPDWRGPQSLSLADDAALARARLEAVGGAHLVGHSYGGAVALHLAATSPRLVRSAVVYEPVAFRLLGELRAHGDATAVLREVEAFMRDCAAGGAFEAAAARFIDFWSGAGSWDRLPPPRRQSLARRTPAVLAHFDALWAEPWRHQLDSPATPPLLVLSGAASNATARTLAGLLRLRLPRARHRVLPGLAHMAPVTDAAAFNPYVVDFLRSRQASPEALVTP